MKQIYQKEIAGLTSKKTESSLISRNITIMDRRTSVRLEPEMWDALHNISEREGCTVHDLCTLIYMCKNLTTSLTAAIRVFLMLYFQAATSESGHGRAGHGNFEDMKRRAKVSPDYDVFFNSKRRKKRAQSNQVERAAA